MYFKLTTLSILSLLLLGCSSTSSQRTLANPLGLKVTSNIKGTWVGLTMSKKCTPVVSNEDSTKIVWKTTPAIFHADEFKGKRQFVQIGFDKTCYVLVAYKPQENQFRKKFISTDRFKVTTRADKSMLLGGERVIPEQVHFEL